MNYFQQALVTGQLPIFSVSIETAPAAAAVRSRKSHQKSRLGCRNCKGRRIKCDETQPEYMYCCKQGLLCEYVTKSRKAPALFQLAPATESGPLVETKCSQNLTNLALIQSHLCESSGMYEPFSLQDLAVLQHFQNFTCNTIANSSISLVYRAELPKLAIRHLYLLHGILAITSLHLTYLTTGTTVPNQKSLFHWQRCLHYFGKKVPSGIAEDDADAMLGTSTLVSGIAFAMIEASTPNQVWPFGLARQLSWIRIQGGIDLIFQAVRPLGLGSAIRKLFLDMGDDERERGRDQVQTTERPENGLRWMDKRQVQIEIPANGGLFDQLVCFCEPDGPSNPYHEALEALAPLIHLECDAETLLYHLSFITALTPTFKALLENKNHKALLVMSFWYAGLCTYDCWWTQQRSMVECRAICEYLETHAEDGRILQILRFPARACGYRGWSKDHFLSDFFGSY